MTAKKSLAAKLSKFFGLSYHDKLNEVAAFWYRLKGMFYYRHIFASFGAGSVLRRPALLTHPQYIHIGDRVSIRQGVRLEAVPCDDTYTPELRIGNNVNIEHWVQLGCVGRMIIADNVSIGSRTMILCGSHPFFDVHDPVKIGARLAGKNAVIEIGEGAFIGSGVSVLQNVRIGKRVVIGSNSVVKTSIPDYCVAEGNPAVVVMRYSQELDRWLPVEN